MRVDKEERCINLLDKVSKKCVQHFLQRSLVIHRGVILVVKTLVTAIELLTVIARSIASTLSID
jgi:hypothetical protein